MDTQSNLWLPLTEYALRSGISISTLRRKIKSNSIEHKMEEGRYLIRGDELAEEPRPAGFLSSDEPGTQKRFPGRTSFRTESGPARAAEGGGSREELAQLREEVRRLHDESLLRWKALDARVAGLAKRLEYFTEHMAELKMLVKIFEEKLDHRA